MNPYELMFIIHPGAEADEQDALVERVRALIEQGEGTNIEIRKWGKRRLAYEIADQREGFYVLINFVSLSKVVDEIDRVLKITEQVIRFMIVRVDE